MDTPRAEWIAFPRVGVCGIGLYDVEAISAVGGPTRNIATIYLLVCLPVYLLGLRRISRLQISGGKNSLYNLQRKILPDLLGKLAEMLPCSVSSIVHRSTALLSREILTERKFDTSEDVPEQ